MRWKEGYNLDYLIEYDESNPISIEKYAQRLIGKTFADVCNQDDLDKSIVVHETSDYETSHENKKRKGGLGEIIEERFFHYQCNNDSSGRTNSSAANLFILNYLEGNVKLSKLLDAFQKSRGVPMIKKSDYSVVTDKIVINVDIESR